MVGSFAVCAGYVIAVSRSWFVYVDRDGASLPTLPISLFYRRVQFRLLEVRDLGICHRDLHRDMGLLFLSPSLLRRLPSQWGPVWVRPSACRVCRSTSCGVPSLP